MSKARRVIAGIAAVIALSLVAEFVIPLNSPLDRFLASTGLGTFIMFAAGGYVARSSFLLPALVMAFVTWLVGVYAAWRLADAVKGMALIEVVINNLPGLALYTIAAAAGAFVGMWLYAFRSSLWLLDH